MLKMPSVTIANLGAMAKRTLAEVVVEQGTTDACYVSFALPIRVRYDDDSIDFTLLTHTSPALFGGGDPVLNTDNFRYVIFIDVAGKCWIVEQSQLPTMETSATVYYPMFESTTHGWRRWQPVTIPPIIPPPGPCCLDGATIQLVAGGSSADASGTDGLLGTNIISNAYAMALNPVDGLVYFNDAKTHLRTWNPETFEVLTSAFANPWSTFSQLHQSSICFDKNGLCYQFGSGSPTLYLFNADGTLNSTITSGSPVGYTVWTDATHSFIVGTPSGTTYGGYSGSGDMVLGLDGITVYICIPYSTNNAPEVLIFDYPNIIEIQSMVVRWDVAAGKLMIVAGIVQNTAGSPTNFPAPTTAPFNPSGTNETDQGEGSPGIGSLLGNVVGIAMDEEGKLYTVASDVNMVRLIDTTVAGNPVRSLSNHDAVTFDSTHGTHTTVRNGWAGWPSDALIFGGDELPAFNGTTGYPGGQMSYAQGICLTDCGGLLIADFGNRVIRHIDTVGILHTIAGTPGNPFDDVRDYPSALPGNALDVWIVPQKIIALGGNKFLISQADDGEGRPDALYLLTCTTPPSSFALLSGTYNQ